MRVLYITVAITKKTVNSHTIAQLLLKKVITGEVYMKPELLLVCLGLLQQLGAWEMRQDLICNQGIRK